MGPVDLLGLVALGSALIVLSDALAARIPWPIPSVLWLTTLASWSRSSSGAQAHRLAAARLHRPQPLLRRHRHRLAGFGDLFGSARRVFLLTVLVVGIHGLVLLAGAKLFKLDLATAMVASQASVGGPSTAVALAAARGWRRLVLPGMAVGLLGYAVGNYAGLGIAALVKGWLGG